MRGSPREYLAANAPSARAVLLPGVAHMIGMEAPAELARLIGELAATLPVEPDGHSTGADRTETSLADPLVAYLRP